MLGKLNASQRKVTIVGGGISGLLAAHYLDRGGWEVHLVEKSERLGGLIRTETVPLGISEKAAHSFLLSSELQDLATELQVECVGVQASAKARYILRDGK